MIDKNAIVNKTIVYQYINDGMDGSAGRVRTFLNIAGRINKPRRQQGEINPNCNYKPTTIKL